MTSKQEMIDHWTANLADNPEQQLQAQGLLEEVIDNQAPSLPEASALLQAVTPVSRQRRHRGVILLTMLAVLLVAWMGCKGWAWCENVSDHTSLAFFSEFEAPELKVKTKSRQEELLLYGDESLTGPAAPWKGLWHTEPDNVVYFAEYVKNYANVAKALPPDTLAFAEKLDPENGWYLHLAAALEADQVANITQVEHLRSPIKRVQIQEDSSLKSRQLRNQIVYQAVILDHEKAQRVMDLWRKSLQKSYYQSHSGSMQKLRVNILNRRHSWDEIETPDHYLEGERSMDFSTVYLKTLLTASLQSADFSTREGQELMQDVTTYTERVMQQGPRSMLEFVVKLDELLAIYQQITVIDTSTVEPAMVKLWHDRYQSLLEIQQRSRAWIFLANDDSLLDHVHLRFDDSTLAAGGMTTHPPRVDIARLAPMRYVDHCMALRGLAIAGCLLCGLMIPYHLLGKRATFVHRVGEEVWQAIPKRQLLRLVLMAVIAPLLYYALLTYLTNLTGKEWSVVHRYYFPWIPAVSVFLLMLLLIRLLADGCLRPWIHLCSPLSKGYRRWGWSAVALLCVPLHGMTFLMPFAKDDTSYLIMLGAFWLPAFFWLCAGAITRIGIGNFYDRVLAGVRCRVVGLGTASLIVVLVLTHELLPWVERYWLSQDTMTAVDAEMPEMIYTAEITRAAQEDLRRAMKLPIDP